MKRYIKYLLIAFTIIFIVISFSYGTNISLTETVDKTSSGKGLLGEIITVMNIVWLPFAIIAGKLFTNDLVYGTSLHLDTTLWNIWNFSKTIANYIIGFVFLVSIFLFFLGKVKNIFSLLIKIVVSTILVNMSWFLLAVLIDLSTILLVTVGAFPMHLVGDASVVPVEKVKYCSSISIDPSLIGKTNIITICEKNAQKEIDADKFFQKMNGLSGPLVYMGTSILNIDKNWGMDTKHIKEDTNTKKSNRIRNMLHLLIILLFVTPIIILVIIGIVRLFWLWIFIAFSPFLILDYIFGGKYISSKNNKLKLSNVIGLIFQPVIVVMAMGISIIFLATVQTAFIDDKTNEAKKELGICGKDVICVNGVKIITIKGNSLKDFMEEVGGFMGYLIITLLTFSMLWGLLKISFHSTDITSSIADRTFKFVEEGAKAVPIIPIGKGVGVGAIGRALKSRVIKKGFDVQATKQASVITDQIDKIFGLDKTSVGPAIAKEYVDKFAGLKMATINTDSYRLFSEFIEKVKKEKPDMIPARDHYFKDVLEAFLQKATGRNDRAEYLAKKFGISSKDKEKITLDKLMNNPRFGKFIAAIIADPKLLKNSSLNFDAVISSYDRVPVTSAYLEKHISEIK